jgi:hypothetical protein
VSSLARAFLFHVSSVFFSGFFRGPNRHSLSMCGDQFSELCWSDWPFAFSGKLLRWVCCEVPRDFLLAVYGRFRPN